MSACRKSIVLDPSGPPQRLVRPDGFKTSSISVGISGDAIRLLANEGSADALVARVEQPGWASFPKTLTDSEYCSIVSVCRLSKSCEQRFFGFKALFSTVYLCHAV